MNSVEKMAVDSALKKSMASRFNYLLGLKKRMPPVGVRRDIRKIIRYRIELKNPNTPLEPLDVAMRVDALLKHGDDMDAIRALTKPRIIEYDKEAMVALLKKMHPIYGYSPDAYRFAGIHNATLMAAGIIEKPSSKRGSRKRQEARPPSPLPLKPRRPRLQHIVIAKKRGR